MILGMQVKEGVRLHSCGHEFCESCISTFVQNKAKDGEVLPAQMSCPHTEPSKCEHALASHEVLLCFPSNAERERYQRLTLQVDALKFIV